MATFELIRNGTWLSDSRWVTLIAGLAFALLLATVWFMRRRSGQRRIAAVVCLVLSVVLHGGLIYFLPMMPFWGSGSRGSAPVEAAIHDWNTGATLEAEVGIDSTSDAAVANDEAAAESIIPPLPLAMPIAAEAKPTPPLAESTKTDAAAEIETMAESAPDPDLPSSLASSMTASTSINNDAIDGILASWLAVGSTPTTSKQDNFGPPVSVTPAIAAHVPTDDFGQRSGDAKRQAYLNTGGDESTEAAVEAGLRALAIDQRTDGAWDPRTTGAGRETRTLGTDRGGAGARATSGITGLALLAMLGSGNTHQDGPYADSVLRGLSYLIRIQKADGSLTGDATVYEANYCHGIAALAMCEAAVMTNDQSALRAAMAAVNFTLANQHPTTGGWRYRKGDPGDLSQLGWQAMVLDAGRRAGISIPTQAWIGTARFLRSVRSGSGGLAAYRPGEAASRTMTAEALSTRLLLGEQMVAPEVAEAEQYLLQQLPGVGKDNYYGWYYSSLALHQLQDDAWRRWNDAMKAHLLSRQQASGHWPTDDEWGGYGGRIYSTATATLCLEVYYRHALRSDHN